jgi:peptidyl-prolyl cis-trans isomerase SurA
LLIVAPAAPAAGRDAEAGGKTLKKQKTSPLTARIGLIALAGVLLAASALAPIDAAGARHRVAPAQKNELASVAPPARTGEAGDRLENGIVASVNDSPISDYDLRQRVALYVATSGARPTEDQLKEIRRQMLAQLETERLEVLEAQKNNISVSTSEVDKAIDSIMSDNHLTMEQMKKILGDGGVEMGTLRGQLAAQIAWTKTVQNQYGDRINVSSQDVDDAFRRFTEGADKPHFRAYEIFEAVDSPEQDAQVLKNMQGLVQQIRQGAPFPAVARQFSQNPTAAQGGDLGLVTEGQLVPELNDALMKLHPGEVSEPIKAGGGYYLLFLRQRYEPAGTKVPDATQATNANPDTLPLARVLLPIGPKPPKALFDNATQAANVLRQHIAGCEHLQELIAQMRGALYFNLGNMQLSVLSPQMREQLSKTHPGETTEPFSSPAGIELIVRCDKAPPKIEVMPMPTRDDVEQQLFEDQIGAYARRYLRDLRRVANIETADDRSFKHGKPTQSLVR